MKVEIFKIFIDRSHLMTPHTPKYLGIWGPFFRGPFLMGDPADLFSGFAISRVESAAPGRLMPWATRFFPKSIKRKVLNFLHEVEKLISVISIQV